MAKFEGVDNGFFGNFQGAGFHHDDGGIGAGDDDVHVALLLVDNRRVDDQLAIEKANANASDGRFKWEIGAIGRGRSAGDGDDIGVVLAVSRKNHGDDLCFIAPGFGKKRAHGAINQAGGEDFFFGRTAFALEEAARNFSGGVGIFAIVDGERKKVAVIGLGRHAGGGENDGIAVARSDSAIRLLGDLSSFEDEWTSPNFDGHLMRRWCNIVF